MLSTYTPTVTVVKSFIDAQQDIEIQQAWSTIQGVESMDRSIRFFLQHLCQFPLYCSGNILHNVIVNLK